MNMVNKFVYRFPIWLKKNLFNTPINSVISIFAIAFLWKFIVYVFDYMLVGAVWGGTAKTCREVGGFCYPFLFEKARFIIYGFYPSELLWRPTLAMVQLFGTIFYIKEPSRFGVKTFIYLTISFVIFFWLIGGGVGLSPVTNDKWGGLPLTVMLAFIGILFSYPFGILLALARRSELKILKMLSVCYIELIRGVPLISVLFMSSVMFPLFLPDGVNFDKLLRAQIAIIMFVSAYMAEVIRGGLASIDKGQYEAAQSLGLSYAQTMIYIIIPQAIRIVIPPTVNTAIGMFKDTSLVLIIALFDLLNTTKTAMRDAEWLGFSLEGYVFVGVIYYVFCSLMSKYSKRLETEFVVKER
ncbi:amino acid ABC transporter permease [Bacteriovorax sp. Seq25_V]|uniref:amino acid ABC transporter permease n=1 Tax=Bacteriovorax sp. Seq25_V TaxID=1201288 RepID=UPI00038A18F7|nr:amino acid ABC transporter permease [Bacteriovorax sp. Seq25_V]EQC43681.1 putative amino acid ABC transporter, permease protein [Bacteriovorax sp. Seq25_V]